MSATSNAARREVRVESDTKTLLQALKATFTKPHSVLGELLQNGRRAGATLIEITATDEDITVRDNGCGIADPAVLLNIGVSGWDEDTKAADACYGLGFIATLFCCATLEVVSRGQYMHAKTSDLIDCKPVGLTPCDDDGFTSIKLMGHTLGKVDAVTKLLGRIGRGFPIDVHVNGEPLPRDHALDTATWVESPMGWTRPQDVLNNVTGTTFYLQGLPIGVHSSQVDDGRYWNRDTRVVHLRSPIVKGRLPERDCVLDPDEVAKLIHSSRKSLARAKLQEFAAAGRVEELCKHAGMIAATESFDLLEALWIVPGNWLFEIDDTPCYGHPDSYSEWQRMLEGPVSFDTIAVRGIWAPDDVDCDIYPLRACHYVRARNGLLASNVNNAAMEWLTTRFGLKAVCDNDVIVTAVDIIAIQEESFLDASGVIACKSIALAHPEYGTVTDGALPLCALDQDDRLLVASPNVSTQAAVKQIGDFIWDDAEDEDAVWRAQQDLSVILAQLFSGKDLSAVLLRVLQQGSSSMDRLLKNSRFTVSFDEVGRPTVQEITS